MFPIIHVPDDAANLIEQLGTKPKFWFRNADSVNCLYKEVRQETGEDWSEKVTGELCVALNLPHAHYDLAIYRGRKGVVTPTFVPERGRLVHGNELLAKVVQGYPGTKAFRVRQHTLSLVLSVMRGAGALLPLGWNAPEGIRTTLDVFVGYLLLDAWIGNTDRHHQNWGFVVSPQMTIHLAPTYDHASSLGRNESDENRVSRLTTRDSGWSIAKYLERSTSSFYPSVGDKPISTFEAFVGAATTAPGAAAVWLDRLEAVSEEQTMHILREVPPHLMGEAAVRFAHKMLELNRQRLLDVRRLLT